MTDDTLKNLLRDNPNLLERLKKIQGEGNKKPDTK